MLPVLEPYASLPVHISKLLDDARSEDLRGHRESARRVLESALRALDVRVAEHAAGACAIVRWIGRSFSDEGVFDAAIDCCEAAQAMASERNDLVGLAHAMNLRGVVEQRRGRMDEAESLYDRARELAGTSGDRKLVAMAEQNLGTLASIRGDYVIALDRYRSSLAAYRRLRAHQHVPLLLVNISYVLGGLRRWKQAERALMEARANIDDDQPTERLAADTADANLLIARARWAEAELATARALEDATEMCALDPLGELNKYRGIALRELGRFDESERSFACAEAIASTRQDSLLSAEVAREIAEVHHRRGRHRESLSAFNRAHRLFSKMRARRSVMDVDRRILRLEDGFIAMAREWGESIEEKDEYTQGHCVRVADYATRLAAEAGLDRKLLLWFRIGALLHDVGKIAVPTEILNKPGKLDDDERRTMMGHCEAGVALLGDMEFPWDIRPMVLHHHEHWDGRGYPRGLKGEAIPLPARVLCIADVYDALTSTRSYRAAFRREDALAIMLKESGTTFDPTLVAIFERLVARREGGTDEGVTTATPSGGIPQLSSRRSSTAVSIAEVLSILDDQRETQSRRTTPSRPKRVSQTIEHLRPLSVVITHTANPTSRTTARAIGRTCETFGIARIEGNLELCLQRVRERSADVLVYAMPPDVADGLADVERLRERLMYTPIVVVGAKRDAGFAVQVIALGAQDYIERGADDVTIERALRTAVERQRRENRMRQGALVDELTGLYNRRGFHTLARQQEKLAVRLKKRMLHIFLDLDGLKQINDTFGHAEGDHALRETADLLRRTFRESDIIARIGGDEFAVLAPEMTEQWTQSWRTRLLENLRASNLLRSRGYEIALSLGVCTFDPNFPLRIEDLLAQADAAMYEAKQRKRRLSETDTSLDDGREIAAATSFLSIAVASDAHLGRSPEMLS